MGNDITNPVKVNASLDMSPEEKNKRMKVGRRKKSRNNMRKKTTSLRLLSIKMGRYRDEVSRLHEENEMLKDAVDTLLGTMESLLKCPTIQLEMTPEKEEIDDGKEECPTCNKRFKQLKRHKCKKVDG